MTFVASGGEIDIHDTFETDIQLGAPAVNGQLSYRLERPDGTLALDINYPHASIIDKGANKYGIQFRVDMDGIWYSVWKPGGLQGALTQSWFKVVAEVIGHRTVGP